MAKQKVLIADESIYIIHIMDFSLGMEGYEVVTAYDGQQALDKAFTEKPDVVIASLHLENIDGLELTRQIRRNPDLADTPVILLGYLRKKNADQAAELGVTLNMDKPFSPRKLVDMVNTLLAK